jgi:hypothetical protein
MPREPAVLWRKMAHGLQKGNKHVKNTPIKTENTRK